MFCSKCGEELEENENFCHKCGNKIKRKNSSISNREQAVIIAENTDAQFSGYSTEKVLEFLEKAKLLETRKYGLENAISNLHAKISNNNTITQAYEIPKNKISDYDASDVSEKAYIIGLILALVAFIYVISQSALKLWEIIALAVTCTFLFSKTFWSALGIGLLTLGITFVALHVIFFIFHLIKITILNKKRKKEQNSLYLDAKKDNNKKQAVVNNARKQLKPIEAELKETKRILKNLYNLNVIYEKYRNMVAISTIYEYFKSGRCHTLEGYTGAYNIYENELRQEIIIGKLDDILMSLEQVKQNQYAVYLAIQEGNRITQAALNESLRIAKQNAENMNQLVESAKKTEYNTKMTAENTEILMYVEAFK